MLDSGAIHEDLIRPTKVNIANLKVKIDRYKNEKKEILLGSDTVGKRNWTYLIEGQRGGIIGAKTWEKQAAKFGQVSEVFDMATLILQVSLVIGAISLIIQSSSQKMAFFISAIAIGLIGSGIGIQGIFQYLALI